MLLLSKRSAAEVQSLTQTPGDKLFLLRHAQAYPYKRTIEIHDLQHPLKFQAWSVDKDILFSCLGIIYCEAS